jgi:GT2 family glycosyltransferase
MVSQPAPAARSQEEERSDLDAGVLNAAVIVCTYTEARWDDLVACVCSLETQSVAPREVIVVVDHNPDLLERVHALGVRAVPNRHGRGLSGARNSGVEETTAPLVAFLDDDAVADAGWMEALVAPFRDERVLGVGGYIEPLWVTAPSRWFPPEFYWVVGCTHRGSPTGLAPIRNPFGASMCMRREIFTTVGFFREGIGRARGAPMGCEETELCIRARQQWPSGTFVFQPASRIQHRVPGERTRWKYFLSRCYAEGLSKALVAASVGAADALATERSYAARVLTAGVLKGCREAVTGKDRSGMLRAAAIVAGLAVTTAGYVNGHRELRHAATA